ncbi:hypothetical protein O9X98_08035 [Agrobacterium salinitolerans]|nr:hypothetical protein [Agrobacterium salinitolerans]
MKVRTRYPALIKGRVKRMTADRLILCLPEDEFEMRETTASDAPVALVVTQHDNRIEYRLHDGVLYTPLAEMPTHVAPETDINPVSALLKRGHPWFGAMAEEIMETVRTKEANETRPERLASLLTSTFIPIEVTKRAIIDTDGIVESEVSSTSIELWKAKAHRRMSEIILIDGQEWVATPEPAYKLWVDHGIVEAHHSDVYDNGTKEVGRWRDMEWEGLHYRYFSALEIDAARRTAAKLGREDSAFAQQGEIEVLIPEAIRHDYADLEIDRASRVCVRKIEKHLKRLGNRGAEELRSFPQQPLMAACGLRDAIAGRKPFDPVDGSLPAALETFLDAMEGHPRLLADMIFEDMDSLRDMLDVWSEREVSLSIAPSNSLAR